VTVIFIAGEEGRRMKPLQIPLLPGVYCSGKYLFSLNFYLYVGNVDVTRKRKEKI